MSATLPRAFSHTPARQTKSGHRTMTKYLRNWLTSEQPYVNPSSGFEGIQQLQGGITELCKQSKAVINKYIRYFHRICVVRDFENNGKVDIMIVAMDNDGNYKPPPQLYIYIYILLFCIFLEYTCYIYLFAVVSYIYIYIYI